MKCIKKPVRVKINSIYLSIKGFKIDSNLHYLIPGKFLEYFLIIKKFQKKSTKKADNNRAN